MIDLITTLGGSKLYKHKEIFHFGNMHNGIDGEGLAQSAKGIHPWDGDCETPYGVPVLDFNIESFKDGSVVVVEVYIDGSTISFRSFSKGKNKLPDCFYIAKRYINSIVPEKAELIEAMLLSLVGVAILNDDIGCTLTCQDIAIDMYKREKLKQNLKYNLVIQS
ncbi:MAG: hypothetical protein P8M49_10720 [Thalassotalea sp.]|nr:hypothetical protein [Thalassotalea sp.]MDG2393977.1 hypothetical protein [Thalassotalea sp.]